MSQMTQYQLLVNAIEQLAVSFYRDKKKRRNRELLVSLCVWQSSSVTLVTWMFSWHVFEHFHTKMEMMQTLEHTHAHTQMDWCTIAVSSEWKSQANYTSNHFTRIKNLPSLSHAFESHLPFLLTLLRSAIHAYAYSVPQIAIRWRDTRRKKETHMDELIATASNVSDAHSELTPQLTDNRKR